MSLPFHCLGFFTDKNTNDFIVTSDIKISQILYYQLKLSQKVIPVRVTKCLKCFQDKKQAY